MAQEPTRRSRRAFLGGLTAVAVAARTKGAAATQTQPAGVQPTPPVTAARAQTVKGRLAESVRIREQAAALSAALEPPTHRANDDERAAISYAYSFTKGLPHDYETGLVAEPSHFEQFVAASDSGDRDAIRLVPLGPRDGFLTVTGDTRLRGWETQSAGLSFDLVGRDAQSLTMPPAPAAGSDELTGEIAEVYAQAALRDQPLTQLRYDAAANQNRDTMISALNLLPWFDDAADVGSLTVDALARRRTGLTPQTAFRGFTPGERVGPYLSQLLLAGSAAGGRRAHEGIIDYGAQTIDQRVRQVEQSDFMTSWDEWFDVQNALAPARGERDTGNRRFITTGRDLATYVHSDALYQPYLNACLVLLSNGIPLDPSLPYQQADDRDHQQGFVLYGAPHVLSMLVEVCSRALKTVWYQKFNVHRRLRPEALGARIENANVLDIAEITQIADALEQTSLADEIRRNATLATGNESLLLPMAYAEGSPMHPSYGAGHAAVAGACVTVLKTFFDHTRPWTAGGDASTAFVPTTNGSQLATVDVYDETGAPASLTVEGELNKLAGNISIGRDWAGVHYFSDYWEAVLLGEQVAIGIMREHMLTVTEDFRLRVPKFDGSRVWL